MTLSALGPGACRAKPSPLSKPTKECAAVRATLDHAIGLRDFPGARSLRGATYAACGARPELRERDQRIVDGERQGALATLARAERRQATLDVVKAFLDFVAVQRSAPERASARPRCEAIPTPRGAPASALRWCTATRHLGDRASIEVRYDETAPQAVRFTTTAAGPLTCADLGGSELRHWQVMLPSGAPITRARCALAGKLAELTAVVSGGEPSTLHVVSPSYLEHDPRSRAILDP